MEYVKFEEALKNIKDGAYIKRIHKYKGMNSEDVRIFFYKDSFLHRHFLGYSKKYQFTTNDINSDEWEIGRLDVLGEFTTKSKEEEKTRIKNRSKKLTNNLFKNSKFKPQFISRGTFNYQELDFISELINRKNSISEIHASEYTVLIGLGSYVQFFLKEKSIAFGHIKRSGENRYRVKTEFEKLIPNNWEFRSAHVDEGELVIDFKRK